MTMGRLLHFFTRAARPVAAPFSLCVALALALSTATVHAQQSSTSKTKSKTASKTTSKTGATTSKQKSGSTSTPKSTSTTSSTAPSKSTSKSKSGSTAKAKDTKPTSPSSTTPDTTPSPSPSTTSPAPTTPALPTTPKEASPTAMEEPRTLPPAKPEKKPAAVSSLTPEELEGFAEYPADLQEVVRQSLALTTQNLRYQFGSSDPKAGGMDCSGTMYRVLRDCGVKDVPRQSDEFCRWVMRRTVLYRTESVSSLKEPAFSALHPGDLLFWTGTYETSAPRELPISHVMIYLGKRKKDGKPIVFGASDGRSYEGQRRNGVSVFDFSLPKPGTQSTFYGYGPVPGLDLEKPKPPPAKKEAP